MKMLKNKFLFKLIVTLCLIMMIFNSLCASKVYAKPAFKSILVSPIVGLLLSIADGVNSILHSTILEQDTIFIEIEGESDGWKIFWYALARNSAGSSDNF